MRLKVIITGATGMVGEGVLLECLQNPAVEAVLSLSRRPSGRSHPKMQEVLVPDLHDLTAVENQLIGYNACFFCAGISLVGVSKEEYERTTHDLTLHVARTLLRLNPGLSFTYVSGAGTDGRGQSRQHWARVKGRTENALLALPFRRAFMFRPGFMKPTAGQQRVLPLYKYIGWLYPVARKLTPAFVSTVREVGQAMIAAVQHGYPRPVLEVRDLVALANSIKS